MSNIIKQSFMGDPTNSFKYFNQGYINPKRESFIIRGRNVFIGSSLGLFSLVGQISKIFHSLFLFQGNKARNCSKKLCQTAFIIPAGQYFTVIFGLHFIAIEIPKRVYKNLADTSVLKAN